MRTSGTFEQRRGRWRVGRRRVQQVQQPRCVWVQHDGPMRGGAKRRRGAGLPHDAVKPLRARRAYGEGGYLGSDLLIRAPQAARAPLSLLLGRRGQIIDDTNDKLAFGVWDNITTTCKLCSWENVENCVTVQSCACVSQRGGDEEDDGTAVWTKRSAVAGGGVSGGCSMCSTSDFSACNAGVALFSQYECPKKSRAASMQRGDENTWCDPRPRTGQPAPPVLQPPPFFSPSCLAAPRPLTPALALASVSLGAGAHHSMGP